MNRSDRIFVAGHRGLVGSAVDRRLVAGGFERIRARTHAELPCRQPTELVYWFGPPAGKV